MRVFKIRTALADLRQGVYEFWVDGGLLVVMAVEDQDVERGLFYGCTCEFRAWKDTLKSKGRGPLGVAVD